MRLDVDHETAAEIAEIGAAIRETGHPALLTGDHTRATAMLALRRGLDLLRAELLPHKRAPVLIFAIEPGEGGDA